MKFKIELNRKECIGCGACASLCPDFWEMHNDGKSVLKGCELNDVQSIETDDLKCAVEAAKTCPVEVIHIMDNEENKKIV